MCVFVQLQGFVTHADNSLITLPNWSYGIVL